MADAQRRLAARAEKAVQELQVGQWSSADE